MTFTGKYDLTIWIQNLCCWMYVYTHLYVYTSVWTKRLPHHACVFSRSNNFSNPHIWRHLQVNTSSNIWIQNVFRWMHICVYTHIHGQNACCIMRIYVLTFRQLLESTRPGTFTAEYVLNLEFWLQNIYIYTYIHVYWLNTCHVMIMWNKSVYLHTSILTYGVASVSRID